MAKGPKITRNDDGLFVRYEFDAHYISDEDAKRIRGYVDQLEAENAKLRERIHELEMEGSDHFYRTAYAEDANRTLEAENAKLRELVREAVDAASLNDMRDWRYGKRLAFLREARELGIEVEE